MKTKLFNRAISLLLVCCALLALCSSTAFGMELTESRAFFSGTPKGVLLYVGYNTNEANPKYQYPTYSRADITKLSAATTEFILCSGNTIYNSYQFTNSSKQQIITKSKINNLSTHLINNPVDIDQIKADYIYILTGAYPTSTNAINHEGESHIDELFGHLDPMLYQSEDENKSHINELFGHLDPMLHQSEDENESHIDELFGHLDPMLYQSEDDDSTTFMDTRAAVSPNMTLDTLADDVVEQVNVIVSAVPNAKIWLPFPHIPFPSLAAEYITPFTLYVNHLKTALGAKWITNIRGFYWGTEAVVQYYTHFI